MSARILVKLILLGGLGIALIVALASIKGLVHERQQRQLRVETEIAGSYAGEQQIAGPLLFLTVEETWTEKAYNAERDLQYDVEKQQVRTVAAFPESIDLAADLRVEERRRGIFRARVFQSTARAEGRLSIPEPASFRQREGGSVRIREARMVLALSDPRGLSEVPTLRLADRPLTWEAGTGTVLPGIHATVDPTRFEADAPLSFTLDLAVHGMGSWFFTPVASENRISVRSPWPHPGFTGNFLPVSRSVSDSGFEADWRVNGLASTVRQSIGPNTGLASLQKLGVRFIDPITPYPLTDRALKYGFLFIGITFAAFFLYEITRNLRIHPIQYGFVGFAQAVFFLLLLGLSEHIRFGVAYLVGTAATSLLLGWYVSAILGAVGRGVGFGALMAALYGALYGLLQSEDHALVAGSVLLFTLLAAVMLLTRNIDWYALTASPSGPKLSTPPPVPDSRA